ncbi:MAG: YfaZ family outer membrane protein [Thermodesulfobacteriota bacterium]
MMLNRFRPVVSAAIMVLFLAATASAGSVSVEINANADDVAGVVEYDSQAFGAVLNTGGGLIFSNNDYTLGNLHIALKDELFAPALTLGLGFKGLVGEAEVSEEDYDVTTIGFVLLGEYDFRKIYINFPLLIFAEFSGSPDPLSFRDTTSYMDFNTGIRAYIVRTAAIVAGYRVLEINFEDSDRSDKLTDDAFYIGLRLTF